MRSVCLSAEREAPFARFCFTKPLPCLRTTTSSTFDNGSSSEAIARSNLIETVEPFAERDITRGVLRATEGLGQPGFTGFTGPSDPRSPFSPIFLLSASSAASEPSSLVGAAQAATRSESVTNEVFKMVFVFIGLLHEVVTFMGTPLEHETLRAADLFP